MSVEALGNQPHDPISISGGPSELLEGMARLNGVRSGSGTAEDPFVISGWDIDGGNGPAIEFRYAHLHYLVQGVDARGAVAATFTALGSDHVTVKDSTLAGVYAFEMRRSDLTFEDVAIETECAREIKDSTVVFHRVRLDVACKQGDAIPVWGTSRVTFLASEVTGVLDGGIGVGESASLAMVDSAILSGTDAESHGATLLDLGAGTYSTLHNVTLRCRPTADWRGASWGVYATDARMAWTGVDVRDCGHALVFRQTTRQDILRDVSIRNAFIGVDCTQCNMSIDGLQVTRTSTALSVREGSVDVTGYEARGVTVDVSTGEGGQVHIATAERLLVADGPAIDTNAFKWRTQYTMLAAYAAPFGIVFLVSRLVRRRRR